MTATEDIFRDPEHWHRQGVQHESQGDLKKAAHCYYLACDMPTGSPPAREALRRLGYHEVS